ncbi:metallophosphoesterase family protein [Streptomyces sp. NBC_00094]|uniref:metallophosphoesterase family protein n=1 Tax=Streptomyces sp. NBC_00094 TaxID=2903620 RepID=UPI00224C914C|nr:metallophosphoesterase family protein [Streptomyces sp. NBC_00094]MCX5389795.1 serine/threonine protein phosphatase [Streptomyces sp. NBC_00094]
MTMMENFEKTVIFGDVHGDADRLERALEYSLKDPSSRLIFTGDYVNRGKRSRQVLDLLIDARSGHPGEVVLLRGNHEESFLKFLDGGRLSDFAAHGGLATIRSYLGEVQSGALEDFKKIFPKGHRKLLEGTLPFYEDQNILVSHAGFDPRDPESRDPAALYSRGHPDIFAHTGPWPSPLTICGHYVQNSLRPYDTENLVCIDTGCGTLPSGPLTGLILPEHRYVQF